MGDKLTTDQLALWDVQDGVQKTTLRRRSSFLSIKLDQPEYTNAVRNALRWRGSTAFELSSLYMR